MMDMLTIALAIVLSVWGTFLVFVAELFFAALAFLLSFMFLMLEDE